MKHLSKNYIVFIFIFVVGAFLRLLTYSYNRPLWLDEASLAISLFPRGIFGFMSPLLHVQSAPPLFMSLTKTLNIICNSYSESVIRFIPLVAGIAAIPVFFILACRVLNKKWTVYIAAILFAINYELIYYSQEFKQYSTDVLFFMLALILFSKTDLYSSSRKQLIIAGLAAIIIPFFSLPACFVIASALILQIVKYRTIIWQKLLIFSAVFLPAMIFYYAKLLGPSKSLMLAKYSELWESGFMKLSIKSILFAIKDNFNFYFEPNNFLLFALILCVWGIILLIKENKNTVVRLILLAFVIAVAASFAGLYPIKLRVSLYLIPITILFITKPFDLISKVKPFISTTIILLFALYFSKYNFAYFKGFLSPDVFAKNDARTTFQILKENMRDKDYIVINPASYSLYDYYSKYFNFEPKNYVIANLPEYNEQTYINILNSLPKGHSYWFYYPYDYNSTPVLEFLKNWKSSKHVLYENEIKKSYILHVIY